MAGSSGRWAINGSEYEGQLRIGIVQPLSGNCPRGVRSELYSAAMQKELGSSGQEDRQLHLSPPGWLGVELDSARSSSNGAFVVGVSTTARPTRKRWIPGQATLNPDRRRRQRAPLHPNANERNVRNTAAQCNVQSGWENSGKIRKAARALRLLRSNFGGRRVRDEGNPTAT